jgi:hypothetical protein
MATGWKTMASSASPCRKYVTSSPGSDRTTYARTSTSPAVCHPLHSPFRYSTIHAAPHPWGSPLPAPPTGTVATIAGRRPPAARISWNLLPVSSGRRAGSRSRSSDPYHQFWQIQCKSDMISLPIGTITGRNSRRSALSPAFDRVIEVDSILTTRKRRDSALPRHQLRRLGNVGAAALDGVR